VPTKPAPDQRPSSTCSAGPHDVEEKKTNPDTLERGPGRREGRYGVAARYNMRLEVRSKRG